MEILEEEMKKFQFLIGNLSSRIENKKNRKGK